MRARGSDEAHRVSTPLELFFDLCFVVAVAQAATSLHHALVAGHIGHSRRLPDGVLRHLVGVDELHVVRVGLRQRRRAYRLAVLVQIVGVLILAAGVPREFDDSDFAVVALGYLVMRLALVTQWLRAARGDPGRRRTDQRYAAGISVCMVGWLLLLLLSGGWQFVGVTLMVLAELSVPVLAERAAPTAWHPRHIAERYGLFTLIVLGESVGAATVGFQSAIDSGQPLGDLAGIAVGGLLVVFSMWWLYFDEPGGERRTETGRRVVRWGYGHYVVFAAAAAVGAGLATAVDVAAGRRRPVARGATLAVAVPVALFLPASPSCVAAPSQSASGAFLVAAVVVLASCPLVSACSASAWRWPCRGDLRTGRGGRYVDDAH